MKGGGVTAEIGARAARAGRWIAFWGAHNSEINFSVCYLAATTQENDIRLASVLQILTKIFDIFGILQRPGPVRDGLEITGNHPDQLAPDSGVRAISERSLASRLRHACAQPLAGRR